MNTVFLNTFLCDPVNQTVRYHTSVPYHDALYSLTGPLKHNTCSQVYTQFSQHLNMPKSKNTMKYSKKSDFEVKIVQSSVYDRSIIGKMVKKNKLLKFFLYVFIGYMVRILQCECKTSCGFVFESAIFILKNV